MNGFWLVLEVFGTALAVATLGLSIWLEPDPSGAGTHTQLGLPPCGYLTVTGKPCVSCGLTTAYACMIRGRVAAALAANPAGVVLFGATVVAPIWLLHSLVRGLDPLRFMRHRYGRWFLPLLTLLLVLCWALRFGLT